PAVLRVERSALLGVPQDHVEDRMQVGLRPGQLDAAAGELDRRLQQHGPRERAVRAVGGLEAGCRARDGAGGDADAEDLVVLGAAAEADVDGLHLAAAGTAASEPRNGDEEVEQPGRAVTGAMDEHEAAGAGAGQRALRDPRGERRGDAGVDGVAALGEDARARLRRQRVAARDRSAHGAKRIARTGSRLVPVVMAWASG